MGNNPYGSPLVLSPGRLIPNSILIEMGIIIGISLFFLLLEKSFRSRKARLFLRASAIISQCIYATLSIIDFEVIRWLGQHITLSYIQNYAGARDANMGEKLLDLDFFSISCAVSLLLATAALGILLLWKQRKCHESGLISILVIIILFGVTISSPKWFRPSEKRWRRIRPAAVSILYDLYAEVTGLQSPDHAEQALSDLISFYKTGDIGHPFEVKEYPFYDSLNLGNVPLSEFKKLDRSKKPNIVLFVFETWRGWKSGLQNVPDQNSKTPQLDSVIFNEAWYFPWTNSLGYPSVEGSVNLHLGILNHYNKIIKSNYLTNRTIAIPEILRHVGYNTHMVVGVDPSFSNFTPWVKKWYNNNLHFDPSYEDDAILLKKAGDVFEESQKEAPTLLTIWTAVTHPPYYVPDGSTDGMTDSEERFDLAVNYTSRQALQFIERLKGIDWENTIVIMTGDHGQPTPSQLQSSDRVSPLSPGLTWVNMAWFGGFKGLPRGRVDRDVTLIDIAPTLFRILDIKTPNHFMGMDMRKSYPSRKHLLVRQKQVTLMDQDYRYYFNIDDQDAYQLELSKSTLNSYGYLDATQFQMEKLTNPNIPVNRYKDMMKAWAQILDEDRLLPPSFEPIGSDIHAIVEQ